MNIFCEKKKKEQLADFPNYHTKIIILKIGDVIHLLICYSDTGISFSIYYFHVLSKTPDKS